VPPGSQRKSILLLDDEPDITSVMSVALKSSGFVVDVFNDPLGALAYFEDSVQGTASHRKYDLIISDIRMPVMDGFEFARRVNALDKEVLITAYEVKKKEFENVLPALRIDALLNKPIGMTRLRDVVHALMSGSLIKKDVPEQAVRNSAIPSSEQ
jgi:CheY-like chemotaxis protein